MIIKNKLCALVLFLSFIAVSSFAIYIPNPDTINLQGLVSFGEDGAAWLSWNGFNMLVTSGYMIGKNLRVVAIRHDSVVLYNPSSKQYHVLILKGPLPRKDRNDVIWLSTPMPIWKITRMVALAYRKDYICNYKVTAENLIRRHMLNMEDMMIRVVSPNHRFYGRKGIIYVAPVHFKNYGWRVLLERIQHYRSKTLGEWFKQLNKTGTIISDGKPLDQVLQNIAFKTGVNIMWQHPVKIPLYCSIKDKPWYQILTNIVLFNGFNLIPTSNGLIIK